MESYFHAYKQYKAGTKQVVKWLVEKSRYHTMKSTSNKSQDKTANIPSSILPKLARVAMESLTPLDVPQHLRTILHQVISARKECAAHHRKKMIDHDKQNQDDLGHEHFIQILEQVSDIVGRTSQLPDDTKLQPNSDDRLINRFEHLELVEPVDREANAQNMGELKDTKTVSGKKSAAPSELQLTHNTNEEGLFAAFCFLMDCHRIRKYLRTVWNDYRIKKISLIAASLTTNMAFDVIAQIHFELARDFPRFSDFEAIDAALFDTNVNKSVKVGNYSFFTISPGREAYLVLKQVAEGYKTGDYTDFLEFDNGMDWIEDCKRGVPAHTPEGKSRRLLRAIPDMLYFILRLAWDGPIDELSRSIHKLKFHESHKVDVSAVIACEIFIDIQHILLADTDLPFKHLLDTGKECRTQIQKNAILRDILDVDCTSNHTRNQCDMVGNLVGVALENDAVADLRERGVKPKRKI